MEKIDYKKIGEKIKKSRSEKKITQKQLAELIEKTESSIRKYEKGLIQIPGDVLEKIAKVLDISLFNLILDESIANLWNPKEEYLRENTLVRYRELKEMEKKVFDKLLNIFSTDLQEYFKLLFNETMTNEEIETLCEDTQNFINFSLTKLKNLKWFGTEEEPGTEK